MAEAPSDDGIASLPVPPKHRKQFLPSEEVLSHQADPGPKTDLENLLGDETTDDLSDPWERESRRWRRDQSS